MKANFIVNPASAGGKTKLQWDALSKRVFELFPDAQVHFTQRQGHAKELASQLASQGATLIVGVGGDGTFNEIINGLFRDRAPINPELTFATLPMGTGSDLIKTLKIPKDPREALLSIRQGRTVQGDVGYLALRDFANKPIERYFLNLVTFGIGGLTANLVNETSKTMGGKISFFLGVLKAIWKYQYRPVAIKINGKEVVYSGGIGNVAVANAKFCGGGMYMAPDADICSGDFQMIILKPMNKPRMVWNLPKIYWGGHMQHPNTMSTFTDCIEAENLGQDVLLEMDGETPGKLPVKVCCLKSAQRLIVGQDYEAKRLH